METLQPVNHKSFKDFGIESTASTFSGEKIEIYNVLNKEVLVKGYKIDPSKYPEKSNGMRLTIHIDIDGRERIIFTGSVILQDMIKKVKADDFPFTATIIKENKGYKFT